MIYEKSIYIYILHTFKQFKFYFKLIKNLKKNNFIFFNINLFIMIILFSID